MDISLIEPKKSHMNRAIDFLEEFSQENKLIDYEGSIDYLNYKDWLIEIRKNSGEEAVKKGLVPTSTYFLMEGEDILGMVDIRHRLNSYFLMYGGHIGYSIRRSKRGKGYGSLALRLALEKCKDMGMKRVLLTCSDWNIASRKIILKNGGVLENILKEGKEYKERYWIEI